MKKALSLTSLILASCTMPMQIMDPKIYEGRILYKGTDTSILKIETRIDEFNQVPSLYVNKDLHKIVEKDSCVLVIGSEIHQYKIFRKDTLYETISLKIDTALNIPASKMKYKNKKYVPQKQASYRLLQRMELDPFFIDE